MACTFESHRGERLLKQEPLTNKMMFAQLSHKETRDHILPAKISESSCLQIPLLSWPDKELLQGPAADQPSLLASFMKELKGALETFNQGLSSKINK